MRRGGLLAAVALAVALLPAAILVTPSPGDASLVRLPSAESSGSAGMAAAARWLSATGRPHRRVLGAAPRPGGAEVWLLLAPAVGLDDLEVAALLDHAAAGGLVVWALGEAAEARQPALARALQARRLTGQGERTVRPLDRHHLFDGLSLRAGGAGVASDREGARPVLGEGERPVAVTLPVGRGEVLLLAGTELLDNGHVAEEDALSLWVRLAARGPIAFDERFLRPAAARAGATRAAGPAQALALQAVLLLLVLVAALWPRLGAVRPPPAPATGRTTHQYLASLAELYRRAGAEPELAAATWRRLRLRLERDAGVAVGLPAAEAAMRLAASTPGAGEPLRRGEAALARGGPGQLLAVAQAAADVEAARDRPGRRSARGRVAP